MSKAKKLFVCAAFCMLLGTSAASAAPLTTDPMTTSGIEVQQMGNFWETVGITIIENVLGGGNRYPDRYAPPPPPPPPGMYGPHGPHHGYRIPPSHRSPGHHPGRPWHRRR